MKTTFKIAILATTLFLMLIADIPFLFGQLVPEAHAILGVRRRTARRTAVVVGSAAQAETAAAQQQAAAAQQQATTAQQEAATAQQQAATKPPPPATASGQPLPLGTVVTALPAGCAPKPIGGVEYYYCGGNYYRSAFQGNSLVYVTVKPE
jgi:hypothetical protein